MSSNLGVAASKLPLNKGHLVKLNHIPRFMILLQKINIYQYFKKVRRQKYNV